MLITDAREQHSAAKPLINVLINVAHVQLCREALIIAIISVSTPEVVLLMSNIAVFFARPRHPDRTPQSYDHAALRAVRGH
jgi:hypothetical protein